MYKVLIVDDEPIILSGVTHLLDWKKEDCMIIATARDGKSALSLIKSLRPDIVICDINIPSPNGIEVLKQSRAQFSETVFIMLTCLEEFSLAKEALKNNASDYLLKTELEESLLSQSINKAKREVDSRRLMFSGNVQQELNEYNKETELDNTLARIYLNEPLENSHINYFTRNKLDSDIALLQVFVSPELGPELNFNVNTFKEQIDYTTSIVKEIVKSSFNNSYLIRRSQYRFFSIFFYLYNVDKTTFFEDIKQLDSRIKTSVQTVVGAQTLIIYSSPIASITNLEKIKAEITTLKDIAFIKGESAGPQDIAQYNFSNSSLEAITGKCIEAISAKDSHSFSYCQDLLKQKIKSEQFKRDQVIWRCEEIASFVISRTTPQFNEEYRSLKDSLAYIGTLSGVNLWLFALKKKLSSLWRAMPDTKQTITNMAKSYIDSNITQRLFLSDIADQIGVSEGYLSTLFSKQCGISVVEYINSKKTEEAMRLIMEGNVKVFELCTALGFENSYYFSKVFKKYAHMSPTEYIDSLNTKDYTT